MKFGNQWRRGQFAAILAAAMGVWSGMADAAAWRMQHSEGYRGEVLSIEIYSQGDGATGAMNATWTFDETRFFVDAPVGPLPGSHGAQCSTNGRGEVAVLRLVAIGTIPATEQVVCTVPLRIRDNAPIGGSVVDASDVDCSAINTASVDCTVSAGRIAVLDGMPMSQNFASPPPPAIAGAESAAGGRWAVS